MTGTIPLSLRIHLLRSAPYDHVRVLRSPKQYSLGPRFRLVTDLISMCYRLFGERIRMAGSERVTRKLSFEERSWRGPFLETSNSPGTTIV